MKSVSDRHRQNWEDLGSLDPYWAVLNDKDKRYGQWATQEFLDTGVAEIETLMAIALELRRPMSRHASLDFGCGLGRLSRALARHFEESYGLDISYPMIESARRINGDVRNCTFVHSTDMERTRFFDNQFDMIYSSRVLQHMPNANSIAVCIQDLARILAVGGLLVFQVVNYIPLRKMIQPRRRLYDALRYVGIDRNLLYNKLGLYPMKMTHISHRKVLDNLLSCRLEILDVRRDSTAGALMTSRTYYTTKPD